MTGRAEDKPVDKNVETRRNKRGDYKSGEVERGIDLCDSGCLALEPVQGKLQDVHFSQAKMWKGD